jgi:hypothetical protein
VPSNLYFRYRAPRRVRPSTLGVQSYWSHEFLNGNSPTVEDTLRRQPRNSRESASSALPGHYGKGPQHDRRSTANLPASSQAKISPSPDHPALGRVSQDQEAGPVGTYDEISSRTTSIPTDAFA